MRIFIVQANWDSDAKTWWAESEDIPGLITEAERFEELMGNVAALAPTLFDLNAVKICDQEFTIRFITEVVLRSDANDSHHDR